MNNINQIPFALFNSKAIFNPYQYKPFFNIFHYKENGYKWNGRNVLIADEVGVGKTFESGIIIDEMIKNNPNTSILIICPVKLCENWERELRENFYLSFNNYRQTKNLGKLNIVPYSYFSIRQAKDKIGEQKIDIEIQSDDNSENSEELKKKIEQLSYDVLILDEAHYIRNKGTLYKSIGELIKNNEEKGNKKPRIFMTATPVFNSENDYQNITSLLEIYTSEHYATTTTLQGEANCYDYLLNINLEKGGYNENESEEKIFKDIYTEYEETNDWGYEIIKTKYGHLTGFLKRIATSSIHSLKCFINKNAQFDIEEDEYYDEEFDSLLHDNSLKDLCNGWKEENDSKFNTLNNLIDKIKNKEQKKDKFKVIIFSTFLDTCEYLKRRLWGVYKVWTITGKDTPKNVEKAKMEFEKADSGILICSDAAKEGHNLQFCHYVIHYDFPFTPAALQQRNGRIYRKGQEEQPEVYYMFVENSYDERVFGEIIAEKSNKIKGLAVDKLICDMNVLPSDAEKLLKECLCEYWVQRIKQRNNEWHKENDINKDKPNLEKLEFQLQLSRKFKMKSDQGKLEWVNDRFQTLYEIDLDDYKEAFLELFVLNNNKELATQYKSKYNLEMKNFIKNVFCEYVGNEEDIMKVFKESADKWIDEVKGEKRFCQDMLLPNMSISDYKEQFVPLVRLEKGSEN